MCIRDSIYIVTDENIGQWTLQSMKLRHILFMTLFIGLALSNPTKKLPCKPLDQAGHIVVFDSTFADGGYNTSVQSTGLIK